MKKERLHLLFQSYINQKCSPEEEAELMQMLAEPVTDEELEKLVEEFYDAVPETYLLSDTDADKIFRLIVAKPVKKLNPPLLKKHRIIRWLSLAAAVAVVLLTVSILLFKNDKPVDEINQVVEIPKAILLQNPLYKNDIKPGGNKAILTLADGSKIVLDDAAEGALSRQGNTTVIKLDKGKLAYNMQTVAQIPSKAILYNTLTTPRGGQYIVNLPDGTTVWLNASTSLKFPTAFTGNERKVEIKGEAYFEVAKNEALPFIVSAGNSEVKVLGTHFNVSAYADDKVLKTTLLEGSVEFSVVRQKAGGNEGSAVKLQPGQQAQLDDANTLKVVEADTKEAVAWKNGYFIFNNEDIGSIMQKIERWYDVKVVNNVNDTNLRFTVNISRAQNVSEVLKLLELTEIVHFKIDGKTITVMP